MPCYRPALHRLLVIAAGTLLMSALAACGGASPQMVQPLPTLPASDIAELDIVTGQHIFVPAYSDVFIGDAGQTIQMAITLLIHNTDPDDEIIIESVQYFNTDGEMVREFIEQPVTLRAMATTGFVVNASNSSGGWGANFTVSWGAPTPVYEPVVEALMVNTSMAMGVSFVSQGRVVSERH